MEDIDAKALHSPADAPAAAAESTLPAHDTAEPLDKEADVPVYSAPLQQQTQEHEPAGTPTKPFDPIEALKLGSMRLASLVKREPRQQQPQQQHQPAADRELAADEQQHGSSEMVARIKATAAGLGARAKEQGSRFYQASVKTAASTAEGLKRLAQGEPVQAICRSEFAVRPCPQLVVLCCTALVSGTGLTTERIFKHDPPQELVDRLAATAGGPLKLLPPGASPHAVAALLKQFLLGLPEPLLTYRLLPQWVAAGDVPASCVSLLQQLPAANAGALRIIMQTCSHINEQAAVNEMDSQALAEVLAPVVAWKPAPKQERPAGPGPWQGITKALTLNRPPLGAGEAAAAESVGPAGTVEGEAGAAGAVVPGHEGAGTAVAAAEVHKVTQLDDAELDAVVTVLEYMITNYNSVFGFGA